MTPHKCPKCNGLGWLRYDPRIPTAQEHTSAGPWMCPPCGGTGILWSSPTAPGKAKTQKEK